MIDFIAIDNFFRSLKNRYRECFLKMEDCKVYLEDNYSKNQFATIFSKLLYFSFLAFITFNPKNHIKYPNHLLVDFISEMWNIKKLICESDQRFNITYKDEYDIEKTPISSSDGGAHNIVFYVIITIAALGLGFILGIR